MSGTTLFRMEPFKFVAEEFETEVAGAVDRRSPAYARWVQRSLNQILGLRLVEDGIIGPQTRSAVRTFQTQRGLTVDGIVGPRTEAALIAAGASSPPGGGATPPGSQPPAPIPPPPGPTPGGNTGIDAPSIQALRDNIVRVANEEWQRWGRGTTKEGNPGIRPVLEDYWRTGTGSRPPGARWWSDVPWSAAFISWVLRRAGAGRAFRYSAGHSYYTTAAKENRLANNSNPFKAYRTTEVQPRPGDLVCKSRAGSGATYDTLRPGMATHCDIVTEVRPGQLTTIGGNVSDSVSRTLVRTDPSGRIADARYFAVIRVG